MLFTVQDYDRVINPGRDHGASMAMPGKALSIR